MLVTVLAAGGSSRVQADEPILVYAAASMTNVVEEIVGRCNRGQPEPIKTSFAASSVLAKQIEHGAAATVFLSANSAWMDYLERRGLLANDSRHRFAGNRLVMIVPTSSSLPENLATDKVLPTLSTDDRIAMGDPDHVPAGIYAKAALESIGVWENVRERAARTANVRAALAFVETGATPVGIVYATDALVSHKVRIVAVFLPASHPPIVYEAALLREHDTPAARRLFSCIRGADAARILERHGFRLLGSSSYADAG
jgi:molybdate transport system substrate-binding protein